MSDSIHRDEACGIIPFVRTGDNVRFLIAHEKEQSGYWKFPKGHAEEGEELDEAALRELSEEAGIEMDPKALIREQTFEESYFYTSKEGALVRKVNTYFLGELEKRYVNPEAVRVDQHEFDDARVVTLDEAKELLQENTYEMLVRAREYLEERFNV